jgi:hypothetical protein
MDPRSPATPEVLAQQLQLGLQLFDQTTEPRGALAEIASVRKQLADLQQKLGAENPQLKSVLAEAGSEIDSISKPKDSVAGRAYGLEEAYQELASALRVVEGGDRAVPSQVGALYQESTTKIKAFVAEWTTYKEAKLPPLNQQLGAQNLSPIKVPEK